MRTCMGLRGAYNYKKSLVIYALEQILTASELEVENVPIARLALEAYRTGPADFADYIIATINSIAGCKATYSFDQKLAQYHSVRMP